MTNSLTGLVAATFSPMHVDGSLNLAAVPQLVDFVLSQGADGIFLNGSTGESSSLTTEERMAITDAYVEATGARAPIAVHVGHNSLADARTLAAHAAKANVHAIAVAPPSYFKPAGVNEVVDCLSEIADAAPDTPLYYYHIPALTGVSISALELLERADQKLPSFVGIKFSHFMMDDLIRCVNHEQGKYNILFGSDEMCLAGLAMGAAGAVGSTYNFLGPFFQKMMSALAEGDVEAARSHQLKATRIIHAILAHGGLNAIKATMNLVGVDCGPTRLPLVNLAGREVKALQESLKLVGLPCRD
ncbi:MAG: dihydrodipicolinate synthetase [Planctomycetes bacterium]|nr:dihydrodipicolinate synthetase [Planctomycetota bacterium]MCP4771463.1 dihydrodipicolinate synthetase [Planctomycetota bacterium]MCP4861124.1 dihydrodipicolinate synthetase [Planctomycetota bacterium]